MHGRVEELALLQPRRRRARNPGERAPHEMKRLALLLVGGVALLVARGASSFGRPVAWVQAALIMWDIAAGGERTLWQDVTAGAAASSLVRWPDGEGDLYLPAGKRARGHGAGAGRRRPRPRRAAAEGPGAHLRPRGLRRAGARVARGAPAGAVARRCRPGRRGAAPSAAASSRACRSASPPSPMPWRRPSSRRSRTTSRRASPSSSASAAIATPRPSSASSPPAPSGRAAMRREFRVEPSRYGRWAFLMANAGRLDSPADAGLLDEIARRRFRDRDADISRQAAALGPQGRAVLALVENRDPDAVTRLIAGAAARRAPRDRRPQPRALRPLEARAAISSWCTAAAIRMVPYSESQDLAVAASTRARVAVPDRRHRPCRVHRRQHPQCLDDVAGDRGAAGRALMTRTAASSRSCSSARGWRLRPCTH